MTEYVGRSDAAESRSFPAGPTTDRRGRRSLVNLATVTVFAVGIAVNVGLLRRAAGQLHRLSGPTIALLFGGALLYRGLQTALLTNSLRQLGWRRAMIASEAYTGCSNSMVGGGAVGTGVKTAMLRSWGVESGAIATSMTVTAIVPSVAMWSLALLQSGPEVVSGSASTNQTVVAIAAVGALAAQIVFWWLTVVHAPLARRIADVARMLSWRAARHCRGPLRPLRRPLLQFDPHALSSQMREEARHLARRRSARLVLVGVASQLCLAFVLIVALWGMGGRQASLVEVFQAFTMARVAASFVPLPGGLGVLDVGLFTGLVHAGASPTVVMAALVVYRAGTFALPIVTGCTALAWWRRSCHRRRTPAPAAADVSRAAAAHRDRRAVAGAHLGHHDGRRARGEPDEPTGAERSARTGRSARAPRRGAAGGRGGRGTPPACGGLSRPQLGGGAPSAAGHRKVPSASQGNATTRWTAAIGNSP